MIVNLHKTLAVLEENLERNLHDLEFRRVLFRSGTTQRDGMGREEGGGFRMGNTCIPVADSF